MKKWVCQVCGYIYEGENAPAECPVCHVGAEKFEELKDRPHGCLLPARWFLRSHGSVPHLLPEVPSCP